MSSCNAPNLAVILLAEHCGSDSNPQPLSALSPLLGQPLIRYPLDTIADLGAGRVLGVASPKHHDETDLLAEYGASVFSPGDGISSIQDALRCEPPYCVLVLSMAFPLVFSDSIRDLMLRTNEAGFGFGRLTTQCSPAVGVAHFFDSRHFQFAVDSPVKSCWWNGDAIWTALKGAGLEGFSVPCEDELETIQLVDPSSLPDVTVRLRERIVNLHLQAGVFIEDPRSTYIDFGVTIGARTILRPMTFIEGNTIVGEACDLGPSVRIRDCVLEDRVTAQFSVLSESEIGEATRIGPFSHLRPGCKIGRKVKIGNFVELKNAIVADRASIGHLAYIGDADLGEHCNIGAGTITCNYDGVTKHRTQIGAEAFVGSHTTLVAPIAVGDGAFTAAGTVVTEDVPADALAIGRARQLNKPEWARKRRENK